MGWLKWFALARSRRDLGIRTGAMVRVLVLMMYDGLLEAPVDLQLLANLRCSSGKGIYLECSRAAQTSKSAEDEESGAILLKPARINFAWGYKGLLKIGWRK